MRQEGVLELLVMLRRSLALRAQLFDHLTDHVQQAYEISMSCCHSHFIAVFVKTNYILNLLLDLLSISNRLLVDLFG